MCKGNILKFSFVQNEKNKKILRECYENHFMKKFKPELN